MARRFHVPRVVIGDVLLEAKVAHHARDVLRLAAGDAVELFDDAGASGTGEIIESSADRVAVRVASINTASPIARIHIAAAVPKGGRADWMIEKLAELGVDRFTPMACERSVVLPAGTGKLDRWQRIAEEASRQSGRAGVMRIDPLAPLASVIAEGVQYFGSTQPPTIGMPRVASDEAATICIGPEGGFTDGEIAAFTTAGAAAVTFARSVLRIETAAIVAAAIALRSPTSEEI